MDAIVKLAVESFGRIDYCINAFGVSSTHSLNTDAAFEAANSDGDMS